MNDDIVEGILGIVVIYKENLATCTTLLSLNKQLDVTSKLDLFIYDNSPVEQSVPYFENLNILKYEHAISNNGVGVAYNAGAAFAEKISKKWILLLDQDTSFPNNLLKVFTKSILEESNSNLFCPIIKLNNGKIFSPFRKFLNRGIPVKSVQLGLNSTKKYSPVNSGMLINLKSFLEVGGYNNKVKLDFSDLEFMRSFSKKNAFYYLVDCIAVQDFSNNETDLEKLRIRFTIFCQDVKNCVKHKLSDKVKYFLIVLNRTMVLTLKTKSITFLKIFFQSYLTS